MAMEKLLRVSKSSAQKKRERIWEIDFIRGFCLFAMILDHILIFIDMAFMWRGEDFLGKIYAFSRTWYFSDFRTRARPYFVFMFAFLSGISLGFARKPIVTAIKLLLISLAYNLVTIILARTFDSEKYIIYFGVLNCFAVTKLIYCAYYYSPYIFAKKRDFDLEDGKLSVFSVVSLLILSVASIALGQYIAKNNIHANGNWFLIFAMPLNKSTMYMDYFPLFPYLGYVMIGMLFGKIFYKERRTFIPINALKNATLPFRALGRYSLYIYIAHIPLIFGLLTAISLIAGKGMPTF